MERTDDLGNGYKIIQDTDCFCFGTDSVLLSDFAVVKYKQKVLDLCSGNGIIPILLCAKSRVEDITGIEIQESSYNLAVKNCKLNNLENRIKFINDDVKNAFKYFESGKVDVITCNPPYMTDGSGFHNCTDSKTIARHEILITFDEIAKISSKLLKFGGKMYIVHRCDRLCDIICSMRNYGIEPKRLQMIHPSYDAAPNMFLIEGISGAAASLKIEKPLYLHKEGTDE